MVTWRRVTTSDAGFTLSELVASLGLLGMILAIAWTGFQVSRGSSAQSDREAWFAREVGAPLERIERLLSQQYRIDNASPGVTPYRIKFTVDQDNDGNAEVWEIQATSAGWLQVRMVETNQSGAIERSVPLTNWSTHNANVARNVPLFRFYDRNGALITDMGQVYAGAHSCVVEVVTVYDGHVFSGSRRVFFRNQ